jgi:hypothetical protein
MIDDFRLFANGADDGGAPIDPEIALLTAYLAGELSAVQVTAVERRLASDAGFRATAGPLMRAWSAPVAIDDGGGESAGDDVTLATREELDRGWHRFERDEQLPKSRSFAALRTTGVVRARPSRTALLGRAAVLIAAITLPVFVIAQGVRAFRARRVASSPSMDIALAPATRTMLPDSIADTARSHTMTLASQPGQWRVAPTPTVSIGEAPAGLAGGVVIPEPRKDDPPRPPGVLATPRGVVRLGDGRIVVAEPWGGLKFFDARGRHLQTIDRATLRIPEGSLARVVRYVGDSLFVVTDGNTESRTEGRVSARTIHSFVSGVIVDANGRVGRSVRVEVTRISSPADRGVSVGTPEDGFQGVLGDGSFVLRLALPMEFANAPGIRSLRATYYRVSADGTRNDSIGTRVVYESEEFAPDSLGNSKSLPRLFGLRAPRAAMQDESMYWSDGSRFDVTAFDLSSLSPATPATSRVLRSTKQPTLVTDPIRSYYIDRVVSAAAPREMFADRNYRPALPAVRNMLTDERGNIWLEHYRVTMPLAGRADDPTDVPRWTILDRNGNALGEVTTPQGFTVWQIGADWILGTSKDSRGVNHVQLYRLTK